MRINIRYIGRTYDWNEGKILDVAHDIATAPKGEPIDIYMNSAGGEVIEGISLHNLIRHEISNGRVVNCYVTGVCWSAATMVMCACDNTHLGTGAIVMMHNPKMITFGEEKDMEKSKSILALMKESILDIYETKSTLSREELSALMTDETFINVDRAIEIGLASSRFDYKKEEAKKDEVTNEEIIVINEGNVEIMDEETKTMLSAVLASLGDLTKVVTGQAKQIEDIQATANKKEEDTKAAALASAQERIKSICATGKISPVVRDGLLTITDSAELNKIADSYGNADTSDLGKEKTKVAPILKSKVTNMFSRPNPKSDNPMPLSPMANKVAEIFANNGNDPAKSAVALREAIESGELEYQIGG